MTQSHSYEIGKVDYNRSGRRNCMAVITWDLAAGRFNMCAEVWNPGRTDIYMGGQCVDAVAAYFPRNALVQRMCQVWRDWHLNDMQAGSPAQRAWLKANDDGTHRGDHYKWACDALAAAGLNPDPGHIHNGKPYRYGSAWLKRDLPAELIAEIEGWDAAVQEQTDRGGK